MSSRSSLPGLKWGMLFAGTTTPTPVLGLRPAREPRRRSRKLPKPRSSILSPFCSASMIDVKTASTITSECFRVRSEVRATSSTSSAFVMGASPWQDLGAGPPSRPSLLVLPLPRLRGPERVAQRRRRLAGRLAVALHVALVVVLLHGPDRQADLLVGFLDLDDLHR